MATLEQVMQALRNADASGNTEDAKRLAKIASEMRKAAPKTEPVAQPIAQPLAQVEQPKGTYVPDIDPASGAATGGMTFVPETAPMPYSEQIMRALSAVGTGADITARTLASGASLGYADKLAAAMASGDYEKSLAVERARTEQAKQALGPFGTPTEIAGGIAGTVALAPVSITARMAGAAPTLANLAKTIVAGGIEGAGLGALEAKGRDQNVEAGAAMGGAIGTAIPGVLGAASRAISPLRPALSTAEQKAVDIAAAKNIPLTPGQQTQLRPLRFLESQLENISGISQRPAQQEAVNREVAKTFGTTATEITPEVIDESFSRLGKQFDSFTQNKTIDTGSAFKNEVQQILNEYSKTIDANIKPILVNQAKGLLKLAPQTSGDDLQKIRSTLARLERTKKEDPELNAAISRLRDSVDDAIERSLPAEEAAGLRTARDQYRNLNIVSQSLGTGAEAQAGNVSLKNIANTLSNRDRVGYARGRGGALEELSRVSGIVANPPSSGTAERTFLQGLLSPQTMAQSAGGAVGYSLGGIPGAMIGYLGTPVAANMAYYNPAVRGYLLNQAAAPLERAIPSFARYGTMGGLLATDNSKR